MAQQVDANISIGGQRISHFTSLRIDQSLFTHHQFEIIVPFEALEDKKEFFFKQAHQSVVGKPISISFKPYFKNVSSSFVFDGVVTELVLHNDSEMVNSFLIRGHSPTYLMEDGVQRRAFIGQPLDKIFGAVLRDYPDSVLKKTVNIKFAGGIDYKTQYDESNFDFLRRLAQEYGEWFYYDGTQLVAGGADAPTEPFVVDGVQHFDMSITLKPNTFSMFHYNYVKHEKYVSGGDVVSGLGAFGDFAYTQSQGMFGLDSPRWPLRNIQFKAEQDDALHALNATNATDLVRFYGTGENPNLNVGVVVDVTTQKLEAPGKYKKENAGKYRITSISHTVDQIGNYENHFEAVPNTVEFPPRNPLVRSPVALPEIATVITNVDPLKLGRVKVQFHWPNQLAGKSSWVRVTFPYTGSSRGMLFIPEKNDQVLISYEANHVDFPVVVGSLYHKSMENDYWFPDNEQKFIRTRGGNKIVFKEKAGKQEIFITNANNKGTNLHISFDGEGVITLQTKGLIKMEAKNIKMTATEDITMDADRDIIITAAKTLQLEGKNTEVKVISPKINTTSTGDTNIKGSNVKIN